MSVEIAGWGWPGNSRKSHFFKAGEPISVCGRWMFAGHRETGTAKTPDDCAACRKQVDKHDLQAADK